MERGPDHRGGAQTKITDANRPPRAPSARDEVEFVELDGARAMMLERVRLLVIERGSAMLSGAAIAGGLALLGAERGAMAPGDAVSVEWWGPTS